MSIINQLLGGGLISGASPIGSIGTRFGSVGNVLVENGSEIYLQTGAYVVDPPARILNAVKQAGGKFIVPGAAVTPAFPVEAEYGNGVTVRFTTAGSAAGALSTNHLYSSDFGQTWKLGDGIAGYIPQSNIQFFSGKFYVACAQTSVSSGLPGAVFSTVDGKSWTKVFAFSGFASSFIGRLSVANSQLFVSLVSSGSALQLYRSTDGAVFSPATITGVLTPNAQQAHGVCFGNGVYVVGASNGNQSYSSTDGLNWSLSSGNSSTTGVGLGLIVFRNALFFRFWLNDDGSNITYRVDRSSNGQSSWTNILTEVNTGLPAGVEHANGVYYIPPVTAGGSRLRSTDGTTWTPTGANNFEAGTALRMFNNKFVAVSANQSGGTLGTSADGLTWTSTTSIRGLGFALSVLLYDGTSYMFNTFLIAESNLATTEMYISIEDVKTAGDRVFFCGNRGFLILDTATDTITPRILTAATQSSPYVFSVAYANGVWVAVGGGGVVFTSTDTITWTSRTSGTSGNLVALETDGSMFIAVVASSQTKIYSTNGGSTWQSLTFAPTAGTGGNSSRVSLTYANGLWVYHTQASPTSVATSTNGLNWVATTITTAVHVTKIGNFSWARGGGQTTIVYNTAKQQTSTGANFPSLGYNQKSGRYFLVSGSVITFENDSAVISQDFGPGTVSTTQIGSATAGLFGTLPGNDGTGVLVEVPGTSNMLLFAGTTVSLSVEGSHFAVIPGATAGGTIVASDTVSGFAVGSYVFVSRASSVFVYRLNSLFSGVNRLTDGCEPGATQITSNNAMYRRIA